ncbi:hypothetical protein LSH36_1863g00030 [Paralvinella palmiformis]|uniref:Uncharacterized protein n=1 Tax=Paralvinella palmiformis TaxID=53620 RepID=A0AAD9IS14_9ANNE|nr:hypothetical protein LSH36_1863g00030 [Paralvinella palmiformis]
MRYVLDRDALYQQIPWQLGEIVNGSLDKRELLKHKENMEMFINMLEERPDQYGNQIFCQQAVVLENAKSTPGEVVATGKKDSESPSRNDDIPDQRIDENNVIQNQIDHIDNDNVIHYENMPGNVLPQETEQHLYEGLSTGCLNVSVSQRLEDIASVLILQDSSARRVSLPSCERESVSTFRTIENTRSLSALLLCAITNNFVITRVSSGNLTAPTNVFLQPISAQNLSTRLSLVTTGRSSSGLN